MGLGISVQSFMSFHCTQWKSWFLLIPHCPEQSHFFLSFLLIAEKIHPNMKSLPAPDHPVLLCCACSSMSGPSSHWVAQTGHNTQVQHHRWGEKLHPLSSGSTFVHSSVCWAVVFVTTAHGQLMFNLLSTRTPHVFSAGLLSQPSLSCHTCFLSGAGLALIWSESHKVPVSLLKALWTAALPSSVTAVLLQYFGQFGIISKLTDSTLHTTNQAA